MMQTHCFLATLFEPMKKHVFKKYHHIIFRIILPLFIGGLIYLMWGDENIFLVQQGLGLDFIPVLRNIAQNIPLPHWMLYNLPDGLWLFSLLQALALLWKNDPEKNMWLLVGTLMAIVHEVGQWSGMLPGTFDILDLVMYGSSSCLSVLVSNYLDE